MTAHRAGPRACSWLIFFACFVLLLFVQKKWASYEALSQQRGIEPATWHWASNEGMVNLYCTGPMDFPMQPLQFQQIKWLINSGTMWDKIEDWQSTHIYIYIHGIYNPNRIIMVNLRQHQFSWGRRVPLSWKEIGKSNFRWFAGLTISEARPYCLRSGMAPISDMDCLLRGRRSRW